MITFYGRSVVVCGKSGERLRMREVEEKEKAGYLANGKGILRAEDKERGCFELTVVSNLAV